jgi:hypothetical protein
MLARSSQELLHRYRRGEPVPEGCPLLGGRPFSSGRPIKVIDPTPPNPLETTMRIITLGLLLFLRADRGQEPSRRRVDLWWRLATWRQIEVHNKPQAFVDRGFVLVSINYRFVPNVTVADHPETRAQSQRLVKVLQEAGIAAKAYPAEGKNHTTINNGLGIPDDRPTQEMFGFLSAVLKK